MGKYDPNDIVAVKNRQLKLKKRIKFLIFCIIALIVFLFYHYRDKWASRLEGIGQRAETILNDGNLAEGNFPIEIYEKSGYQLEFTDNTLFLLSDANLYLYNINGGFISSRQHVYSNPIIKTAGKYVMLYESGGSKACVETKRSVVYDVVMEHPIVFARVSEEGYLAVVTVSDKYPCELSIYDVKGRLIYSRQCIERLVDICFTGDSFGAMLSFVIENNGELATQCEKNHFSY